MARRTGVPATTLRYYDRIGLLVATGRTSAGYRCYDDSTVEQLRFIAAAKSLGLSLTEIGELVELRAVDGRRTGERLRSLIASRQAEARRRISELSAFIERLSRTGSSVAGRHDGRPCDGDCGCALKEEEPGGTTGSTLMCTLASDMQDGRRGPVARCCR